MNDEEKPICSTKFLSFDYSKVEGIPELKIKVEFLNKMLSRVPDKNNKRVLEVGVGAGETTILLLDIFKEVVVVEPNSESCNKLIKKIGKEGLSNVKFIKSKIEDADLSNEKVSTSNLRVISTSLKLNLCKSASQNSEHYDQLAFNMKGIHEKFDNIILSCVIEHLKYPVQVLKKLSTYLNEGGIMHIIIAQANSLHRLLGVKEGVIANTGDLSPTDIELGHYRVYTPELLYDQIKASGLKISFEQSFYLKPLTISMLSGISMDTHRALSSLGEDFPELACYIYVEATRKDFKIQKR